MTQITSLQQLRDALTEIHSDLPGEGYDTQVERESLIRERAAAYGLPTDGRGVDWTDLPTFGSGEGAWPADTQGVWSWDETHMLVGSVSDLDGLQIVPRADDDDDA